jgi:hypothetical protein
LHLEFRKNIHLKIRRKEYGLKKLPDGNSGKANKSIFGGTASDISKYSFSKKS